MGLCQSVAVADAGAVDSNEKLERAKFAGSSTTEHCKQASAAKQHQKGSADHEALHRKLPSAAAGSTSLRHHTILGGRMDDIKAQYTFDRVLGKGQFGVTRLVIENSTGEQFACKSISKRKLMSLEDMEDVRREIRVMHHLSGHPNVVTFKGAYEDKHHIHIVMELCTGE